ncbi:hypothetical protein [Pseudonocardia sp. TRM90224]|uniref:hypothetical protein n=1 Tax=Pseudonocardia sp. TRM90224 TaxID=2812678 RepID=UPI001E4A0107|nr:hypothetical protein [Pseudonocardia sp. TRM90224]
MVADTTFRPELVPTWAKVAAWAVPVLALPSAGWRLVTAAEGFLGRNPCMPVSTPLWEMLYVPTLSVVQMAAALATIGLVRPWGEVFPRWLPIVGGRRVPVALAVGIAAAGALLMAAVMVKALIGGGPPPGVIIPPGCEIPRWDGVLRFYVPLFFWPPTLVAVTAHYLWRRRDA